MNLDLSRRCAAAAIFSAPFLVASTAPAWAEDVYQANVGECT